MNKKVTGLMVTLLACGLLAGCGQTKTEAKVLNIRAWNTEFQERFRAYSKDYVKTLDNGDDLLSNGTVVKWSIVANDNNGYQIALDAALENQASAKQNEKVDMFLAEADYILKYANSDYSLDVKNDIGLTDSDLEQQYKYTQEIATSEDGKLKGVTWQATPGLFAYRRDIAKEVLGTDDPTEVQAKINTWEKFNSVAADMKAKGKYMLSGYDDSYRTFSNNMSNPWVKDGKVSVDPAIKEWVDQTKNYTDQGYSHKTTLWSKQWQADQGPAGDPVFGFFYSTWGINFTLESNSLADSNAEKKKGNGLYGEYGVVEGPASYYWGGTWMMPCKGTDNALEIRSIMRDLTCNATIEEKITRDTLDYTNNKAAMNKLATDATYGSEFLGGQNHIALFQKSAEKISMKNMTAYDQGCNEKFQNAMHSYFEGTVSYDDALKNFKTEIKTLYPELTFTF